MCRMDAVQESGELPSMGTIPGPSPGAGLMGVALGLLGVLPHGLLHGTSFPERAWWLETSVGFWPVGPLVMSLAAHFVWGGISLFLTIQL